MRGRSCVYSVDIEISSKQDSLSGGLQKRKAVWIFRRHRNLIKAGPLPAPSYLSMTPLSSLFLFFLPLQPRGSPNWDEGIAPFCNITGPYRWRRYRWSRQMLTQTLAPTSIPMAVSPFWSTPMKEDNGPHVTELLGRWDKMAYVNTNSDIMWSLGKWLILGLGKGIYKVNPEQPEVSESKEILERKSTKMGVCQRDIGAKWKSSQRPC